MNSVFLFGFIVGFLAGAIAGVISFCWALSRWGGPR